jgi:hypothetical protein
VVKETANDLLMRRPYKRVNSSRADVVACENASDRIGIYSKMPGYDFANSDGDVAVHGRSSLCEKTSNAECDIPSSRASASKVWLPATGTRHAALAVLSEPIDQLLQSAAQNLAASGCPTFELLAIGLLRHETARSRAALGPMFFVLDFRPPLGSFAHGADAMSVAAGLVGSHLSPPLLCICIILVQAPRSGRRVDRVLGRCRSLPMQCQWTERAMPTRVTFEGIAAALSVPERMLLFCLVSDTD